MVQQCCVSVKTLLVAGGVYNCEVPTLLSAEGVNGHCYCCRIYTPLWTPRTRFTQLTQDCTAKFSSNHIKFADDTTVVGLISNNDETPYREEVAQLVEWCGANNLSLNASKTKEVVMNFRRNSVDHPHWPSTARLWRESSALNSWGCT